MTFSWWSFLTQIALLVLALGLVHKPLGLYMARVFTSSKHLRAERLFYQVAGVDADADQTWSTYLRSLLAFSVIGILLVFGIQRLQGLIPGQGDAVDPWVAMNTAISFVTNTNWQSYVPESTVGIVVQMMLLAVQNFLSAAVGIAVAIALIRGLRRTGTDRIGNFWVDVARGSFRLLLPLALLAAIAFVVTGVVQNFTGTAVVNAALGVHQQIPGGPVASQEAIKLLGTNGGGYFNANSAHPFENPNGYSNLLSVFLILAIPFSLPYTYGRMLGSQKQGYTILTVMGSLWAVSNGLMAWVLSVGATGAGVSGEGMEQRFGPAATSIFASSTTLTSTGAVNAAHDSLPPLVGGLTMLNMMLGEVAPGGVGSGLYGMLVLAIIAVFLAGLMVGRTPEFVGKKITARQMKLAAIYLLVTPTLVLAMTGITLLLPDQLSNAPAPGGTPHQFSEVLYAFTSAANNNGSAFGGITSSGPYLATMLGLAMLLGRFVPIVLVLALAGSLAQQRIVPASSGTVPTHGPLFASLLAVVSIVLTALTYFPALALGPLAEGLTR
ncbi:potassium-transporting ATPase subunit KdpA [Psychromicrobium xiongbiense]|uniref:potassium-transporting ATPase subunit KdpA n=1 Tax=Psychromicrobium xiongbiense TaxID=3051184 RepID=UPI002556DD42|nr:potassium-transporting ATPase subunit KdpA [Psychromicrobium sp. YIM S02556]